MKIRNPSGRPIRLEILAGDATVMTLELDPHGTVNLTRWQAALDAMERVDDEDHPDAGEVSPDD